MAGDVTIGYLKRLSYDPENSSPTGSLIAGQEYTNVYFLGGFANFTDGGFSAGASSNNIYFETLFGQSIIIDAVGGGTIIIGNAGGDVLMQAIGGNITMQNGGDVSIAPAGFLTLFGGDGGRMDAVDIGGQTPGFGNFTVLTAATFNGSIATGIAAAGTTQAGATPLAADTNVVSTVGSSSGVALPLGQAGMRIRVYNTGANTLKIYPLNASGGTIDGGSGNAAVTLTTANRGADFECTATNVWKSNLIGAATS